MFMVWKRLRQDPDPHQYYAVEQHWTQDLDLYQCYAIEQPWSFEESTDLNPLVHAELPREKADSVAVLAHLLRQPGGSLPGVTEDHRLEQGTRLIERFVGQNF